MTLLILDVYIFKIIIFNSHFLMLTSRYLNSQKNIFDNHFSMLSFRYLYFKVDTFDIHLLMFIF